MFLNTETLAMLEIASRCGLRGTLPNGVPKIRSAIVPLMMNFTWSLVTVTRFVGVLNNDPPPFSAFTLISVVAGNEQPTPKPKTWAKPTQASPAYIPTELFGALGLPKNGRALSPTNELTNAVSKKSPKQDELGGAAKVTPVQLVFQVVRKASPFW